jgi:hypothetical protein
MRQPPGFVPPGTGSPFYFRGLIYGEAKSGKTVFCSTWPAPLFIHTAMESGYDSFRFGQGHLFPFASIGAQHHLWLQSEHKQGRRFSDDLRVWIEHLAELCAARRCPYQTVVLGAFNVMQQLVISEGDDLFRDGQKGWGYVASWTREVLATLCALPLHVIFECNAEVRNRDRSGNPAYFVPGLKGQGYGVLLAAVNAAMYQEITAAGYTTFLSANPKALTNVRVPALWAPEPIINCSYDWFAERLGMPPIWAADPQHPRCRGVWPWPHPAAGR